jgi:hypothetical protein
MQYNKPYDQANPDAAYVNGNPATGTQGSIPPAEAIEYPQREIVAVIEAAGFTPNNSDLTQLLQAIRALGASEASLVHYGVDTGTANALMVDVAPNITAYAAGVTLVVVPAASNSGAATINADGRGIKSIKQSDGSTALQAGDIAAGKLAIFVYDGTNFRLWFSAASIAESSLVHYGAASGTNTLTATVSPAITSLADGTLLEITPAAANTGPATLNPNGLGGASVKYRDGTDIVANEFIANEPVQLMALGGVLKLLNPRHNVRMPKLSTMLASGTFTPSAGAKKALVFVTGGGGAGGGAKNTTGCAPGGGAGATAIGLLDLTGVSSIAATVGAGGTGVFEAAGGAGSSSSFGAILATGGAGGGYGDGTQLPGALGGTASGGALNIPGGDGCPGLISQGGGNGGGSFWGGGGSGANTPPGQYNGFAGRAYGAGGGGADTGGTTSGTGGNGAPGAILILEF